MGLGCLDSYLSNTITLKIGGYLIYGFYLLKTIIRCMKFKNIWKCNIGFTFSKIGHIFFFPN